MRFGMPQGRPIKDAAAAPLLKDEAFACWCKVTRTSVANLRYAVVADAFAFVANCGYRLGYQRQLSADALLTFADCAR